MNIKKKKIELPTKETMLFMCNSIYDLSYSSNLSKSKIYERISNMYKSGDSLKVLLEVLSFDAYKKLENIYNDYKEGNNINESFDKNFSDELLDVMIFILEEVKYNDNSFECFYKFDIDVIKNLGILFTNEAKMIAKKEYTFERVIKGLLNTYGIMKKEYFLTFVNSYLNENYTMDSLMDKIYTKLVLNTLVDRFSINWKNLNEKDDFVTKIPYEDKLGSVAEAQKQLSFDYNMHELDYILDMANVDYLKIHKDFVRKLKEYNPSLKDKDIDTFISDTIAGIKQATELLEPILEDVSEELIDDVIEYLANWHDELEIYPLCGYSPNELNDEKLVN